MSTSPEGWRYAYLDQKDYRYEETVKRIDFTGKNVIDLCSGNTGLHDFVKDMVASYRACDKYNTHPVVEVMDDAEFCKTVENCDVLCCFGIGGWEITGESSESSTVTNSILILAEKFQPQWIVLECVKKFRAIADGIAEKVNYTREDFATDSDWWLDDRLLVFLRRP